jgi:hypothetical protein
MTEPSMRALVDILNSRKPAADEPPREWQELEDHVQHVYQTILELEGKTVLVAKDVQLTGRQGSSYQIDVYYEFDVAGMRHRVAIECKNLGRPVDRDRVIAFKGKVDDCLDVRGVIVAANGFQSGARKFAEDNGITALALDDLPSIGRLLGMRLEHVAIPGESSIGAPFWTLYDVETAAPFGQESDGERFALLFFSRQQALAYKKQRKLSARWAVRGLSQHHLGAFILVCDACAARYLVAELRHRAPDPREFFFFEIPRAELIAQFDEGKGAKPPPVPMVAPHFQR